MDKGKAVGNALLFDAFKAHAEYGKNRMESIFRDNGIGLFVKYDLKNINRFIAENHITSVVVFIYDPNHYHQLVSFVALGLKVLVCSSVHDIHLKGLEELGIPFLDMGLPKKELFQEVHAFLLDANTSDAVA